MFGCPGSVVQVSPGYLSTNTTEALRDIYGVGSRSAKTFRRSDLYKGVYRNSIGTTTDPAYHAAVRKLFVPSFQPGRLKEHEAVMKACIGKLHNLIKSKMQQNDTLVLNELFHSLSVDLVMEVLLGKSSGCLERGV
jgi:cytochrome P450